MKDNPDMRNTLPPGEVQVLLRLAAEQSLSEGVDFEHLWSENGASARLLEHFINLCQAWGSVRLKPNVPVRFLADGSVEVTTTSPG